jgi:uncharacterized delta-60 repeat protein
VIVMRAWRSTVLVSAVLLAMSGVLPASAAPGDLDRSFSGDGKVLTPFGQWFDDEAVAVGAHGTIVIGGTVQGRMGAVRYLSDGRVDRTFGGDGKTAAGFNGGAVGNDMALLPGGKVVVAGAARIGTPQSAFALARFRANGALDPSFSGDGRVTTAFPFGWAEAAGVAVQTDGKIVVVGSAQSSDVWEQAAMARYLPAGGLDPTFGVGGIVITPLVDPPVGVVRASYAKDVAVQPDGKIVVVGWVGPGEVLFLARYLPDGRLDPTFGRGDGVKFSGGTHKQGFALALQPDGKIVVTGHESEWNQPLSQLDEFVMLARFLPDGRPDLAFGDRGLVRVAENGSGEDVAVAPDGTIVTAATFMSTEGTVGGRFTVARLRSDGTIDDSFGGGNGLAWTTFEPGEWTDALGVAIQPDGRIIAAGWSGARIALARFMAA